MKQAPLLLTALLLVSCSHVNTTSLPPHRLPDLRYASPKNRAIAHQGLRLANGGYRYRFGGDSPAEKGFDCSGVVYHCLCQIGHHKPPRTSYDQYRWLTKAGTFHHTHGAPLGSPAFQTLRPGDLLFWTGTYHTKGRNPPISHVMIYLGRDSATGKHTMVGATEGRKFGGEARNGVSVVDFKASSGFYGYGQVPG